MRLLRFIRDERGSVSIMTLTWLPLTLMVGGLALDTANAMRVRTQLQTVADSAAHAALYVRETQDAATARAAARNVVATALPSSVHGAVVRDEDIVFGNWDPASQTFTPDPTSRSGVRVDLARVSSRANPVGTWLLQMAGFTKWDIQRIAVFETWQPGCLQGGFVAEGRVDMQSGNMFLDRFCIHSNTHVEFNNGNILEEGVTVSMPDTNDLVIPSGGFISNLGLQEALRDDWIDIRVLRRLPHIIDEVGRYGSDHMPDYITSGVKVTLPSKNPSASDFVQGRIHSYTCGSNEKLTIGNNTVLRNLVLTTNCNVKLGSGVKLESVVIATTNTDVDSINTASGVELGLDDLCAPGGGSQILTLGGARFPSKLSIFGGQIVAKKSVDFAAQASGVQGASIVSGGEIDGTSLAVMGFCDTGSEDYFRGEYFRLAY